MLKTFSRTYNDTEIFICIYDFSIFYKWTDESYFLIKIICVKIKIIIIKKFLLELSLIKYVSQKTNIIYTSIFYYTSSTPTIQAEIHFSTQFSLLMLCVTSDGKAFCKVKKLTKLVKLYTSPCKFREKENTVEFSFIHIFYFDIH